MMAKGSISGAPTSQASCSGVSAGGTSCTGTGLPCAPSMPIGAAATARSVASSDRRATMAVNRSISPPPGAASLIDWIFASRLLWYRGRFPARSIVWLATSTMNTTAAMDRATITISTAGVRGRPSLRSCSTTGAMAKLISSAKENGIRTSRPKYSAAVAARITRIPLVEDKAPILSVSGVRLR